MDPGLLADIIESLIRNAYTSSGIKRVIGSRRVLIMFNPVTSHFRNDLVLRRSIERPYLDKHGYKLADLQVARSTSQKGMLKGVPILQIQPTLLSKDMKAPPVSPIITCLPHNGMAFVTR